LPEQVCALFGSALLLALIKFPDFDDLGLERITLAVERIAGIKSPPISSGPPSRRKLGRSHGRDVPASQAVEQQADISQAARMR
jgi:hypothetical protein